MTGRPDRALREFRDATSGPDEEIDLARAALVLAKLEYPDLQIEPYLGSLQALAARVLARSGPQVDTLNRVEALGSIVLGELGLRGATENYYEPRNSFLNDVIDRKLGIPVSLSVIYMAVGARAGIALGATDVPMHFLVRVLGVKPLRFVDCYSGGRLLTIDHVQEVLRRISRGRLEFSEQMLAVVSNRAVLTRMLTNLKQIYVNALNYKKALPILDRLLVLDPTHPPALRERGLVHYRLGQRDPARRDLQHYLDSGKNPTDAAEIRKLLRRIG